jgi:hypothetical protein
METALSTSAGIFRMEKAVVSAAIWSLVRGPSARGGRSTREKATLERAGEEKELSVSSKGRWEVLQLVVYECNGLAGAILHVRGDAIIGTNRGPSGNEPVDCMISRMRTVC